jgi:hypothetical protein
MRYGGGLMSDYVIQGITIWSNSSRVWKTCRRSINFALIYETEATFSCTINAIQCLLQSWEGQQGKDFLACLLAFKRHTDGGVREEAGWWRGAWQCQCAWKSYSRTMPCTAVTTGNRSGKTQTPDSPGWHALRHCHRRMQAVEEEPPGVRGWKQ